MKQRAELEPIALVGLWHLGSVSAAAWTGLGHRVFAWDPDPQLRAAIRDGRGPVHEPGLELALRSAVEGGSLTVAKDAEEAVSSAPVTHLAYDTHVGPMGESDDPRLDEAVQTFARAAPDDALLVVSSQLAVGTCARWRAQLVAQRRGLVLAHVPENLRLGSALDDFRRPSRLLIGADDDQAFSRTAQLFATAGTAPMRLRLASAEMAKHATNAYLALCIAFGNDLAWLSLFMGADPREVAAGLRADPRVSPSAPIRPGSAFSGATLSRDLNTLRALGERFDRSDLFAAVLATNERHALSPLHWLEEELGSLAGAHVAVAGLTYKAGTSTIRDSLPLRLVGRLVDSGATVTGWDPAAESFDPPPRFSRSDSLQACVEGADALVVLTAHPELADVDWKDLRPARPLLVDSCLAVDRDVVEAAGWTYRGFAPS